MNTPNPTVPKISSPKTVRRMLPRRGSPEELRRRFRPHFTSTAVEVLLLIAGRGGFGQRGCTCNQRTICSRTTASARSVKRAVKVATEAGLLHVRHNGKDTTYWLRENWPECKARKRYLQRCQRLVPEKGQTDPSIYLDSLKKESNDKSGKGTNRSEDSLQGPQEGEGRSSLRMADNPHLAVCGRGQVPLPPACPPPEVPEVMASLPLLPTHLRQHPPTKQERMSRARPGTWPHDKKVVERWWRTCVAKHYPEAENPEWGPREYSMVWNAWGKDAGSHSELAAFFGWVACYWGRIMRNRFTGWSGAPSTPSLALLCSRKTQPHASDGLAELFRAEYRKRHEPQWMEPWEHRKVRGLVKDGTDLGEAIYKVTSGGDGAFGEPFRCVRQDRQKRFVDFGDGFRKSVGSSAHVALMRPSTRQSEAAAWRNRPPKKWRHAPAASLRAAGAGPEV